jgi:hypothetical protein
VLLQVEGNARDQKTQQKSKATFKLFAIEHAEMSEFSDASDNIKEIPKMQGYLDNMETDNHYVILSKFEI